MRHLILAFACVFSACSSSSGGWSWAPDEVLRRPPTIAKPDSEATYLLREARVTLGFRKNKGYTHLSQHAVLKVLSEKGYHYASVRVPYNKRAEVVGFEARTIGADGAVQAVRPENVFEDESDRSDDKDNYRVRVFAFPGVKVGSVLEYRYTLEYPYVVGYLSDFVAAEIPTEDFRLEIIADERVPIRFKAYNAPKTIALKELEAGARHLLLTAQQVAPFENQVLAPDRGELDAWWAIAVQALIFGGEIYPINRDWDSTFDRRAETLLKDADKFHDGARPPIDVSGCGDPACRVRRALSWVNQVAPANGQWPWPGKDRMQEVLDRGEASGTDRGRILARALETLEVEYLFAFTSEREATKPDLEAPSTELLNHLLLYLPSQASLGATWIDPGCGYCGLGQISERLNGSQALVLTETTDGPGHVKYVTRWETIRGEPGPTAVRRRDLELRWREGGDVELGVVQSHRGRMAQRVFGDTREWSQERWKKDADEKMKLIFPSGELLKYEPVTLNRQDWQTTYKLEVLARAHAVVDGDRLILPLTFLEQYWDGAMKSDDRRFELVVRDTEHNQDVLAVPIPAGYQLESAPPALKVEGGLFRLDFEARPGDGVVVVHRHLDFTSGRMPKGQYEAARRVFDALRQTQKGSLVFKRGAAAP